MLTGGARLGSPASLPMMDGPVVESLLSDSLFSEPSPAAFDGESGPFFMCNGQLLLYCKVTDEFGWRTHPIRRRSQFHTGIDLAAVPGSHIFAAADGVVKKAGWGRGYGRMIEIDHGYSWSTKYGHMRKVYVKKGQMVRKGDIIGEVGSTGVSTGPHLHFEMLYFGTTVDPRQHFFALDNVKGPPMAIANR